MYEDTVKSLLTKAGVAVDGGKPWDIHVHNPEFYRRVLTQRSLGLGESYMDGWWDCKKIDQLFNRLLSADISDINKKPMARRFAELASRLGNLQARTRSYKVAQRHYDPESKLILAFLDPYNQYTCGYFHNTTNLNTAQEKKLNLICRKLQLSSRDRVLDIGCGWGGFARYAAENYNCHVTGVSNSGQQIDYARLSCKGLPVEFIETDYRNITGRYDKVLICGMIEHVGYKNYARLMRIVYRCLSMDGLFLLQTIGGNKSQVSGDPWLLKYFFPNSMLPSLKQLTAASEGLFVLEDLHNFGQYYDSTFMAWADNFKGIWPTVERQYDQRIYRMWHYYFCHMAGTFRSRLNQLWQLVFSKSGVPNGYEPVR
jgi:cyclopropane-fatty-acyl-phospholipid synthase